MTVVETTDLTKVYSRRTRSVVALDGVSLSVEQGEIFGLLGPNGAGKTTLVKCLLGITAVTSGSVLLNGLPPEDPRSRARVGFLPENHRFPAHLTGRGLLYLAGRMHGLGGAEIEDRTDLLLEMTGMDKWADTLTARYSKGMAQRIGLAQALIADPDIVFLDEPTDGVDPVGRVEIRQVLERLREEGKTIFLNSHLLSEVEHVADRVAILSRGKLVRVATVAELTSRGNQFEIEAQIGDQRIEVPPEVGKRIAISRTRLLVEVKDPDDINVIIDQLRLRRIKIRSVKPLKTSLEQSFIETLAHDPEVTA